ncbi:GntR family transcriptional regulator [Paracoccus luteus]|uniref:GntR family transcriptional regulator n=1 Tax=Paracoccus luteus TaxID=2508543 RepID=UPI0010703185|nr:GntR family transcriptional regulator [Paracoccus luteus]
MNIAGDTTLRIEKATLYQQVLTRLRDLIIEGELAAGERIDESALIEQLGVSRTPFREALRTLAAEGLVETRPARGTVVRALTAPEVRSMLELLAGLERMAGDWACQRADDATIAALVDLHDRMMAHYARRDRMPYYKLNQAFHTGLVAAAGNPALAEVHGNIQARLKRIRFVGHRLPQFWAEAVAEHAEMVRHLTARDGAALGETMSRHLTRTWDRVSEVVI